MDKELASDVRDEGYLCSWEQSRKEWDEGLLQISAAWVTFAHLI